MNSKIRFDRLILSMEDDELEQFCRTWVERRAGYTSSVRLGATGDKGLDVVGFVSAQKFDGAWDNYQCKQYRTKLSKSEGLLALGKVIYWASQGEFSLPRKFYFVAPKGVSGAFDKLINNPSKLKSALIDEWENVCARKIIASAEIVVNTNLRAAIDGFDFANVSRVTVDEILDDAAAKPLLVEKWGADPGDYPRAAVPADVANVELAYIHALVEAYSEREKTPFADHQAVLNSPKYGRDLRDHRERYFEAESFQKFYRDNTSETVINDFRRDIRFGVQPKLKAPATDRLARVEAVMGQAATITPAGPLAKYARVPVKQGLCHHFVNDGEMDWKDE